MLAESAVRVTADSIDPDFAEPFIDIEEERSLPVPHRYVSGGFAGTGARFSFYFPPAAQYRGRFFHNTYPMAVTSDIGPFPIQFDVAVGDLGFTLDSGAAYVQTNNGGAFRIAGLDPAIAAYRVNAAAAKFCRTVAARLYGAHRAWGYLFGGSGGAYQTMGAAENTSGVWDGFMPFVPGCNHAIPSMFTARMHALRVLGRRGRLPAIADALEPGGSGDPFAGLDEAEAAALHEVHAMGFPPRGWYLHATMGSGYFANIAGMIPAMDPTYAEDFWTLPGYAGSDPDAAIRQDRYSFEATVVEASAGPPFGFVLDAPARRDCANAHLVALSGTARGASLPIHTAEGCAVRLIMTADAAAAGAIRSGDRVRVDNSWALALETYHRHQVPDEADYIGWDQFRDAQGAPVPPQRGVMVGPMGTYNSAGSVLNGRVNGKVLLLACLMDIDSYPWQADWYRGRIAAALGDGWRDSCALWFIDNAHHENPLTPLQAAHVTRFSGALQRGLRDLARWVEEGVRPDDTACRIEGAQVLVPADAAARGGVQPVVTLTANGGARAEVAVGEDVVLAATVEVPPGAGHVVSAEWDVLGSGDFPLAADPGPPQPCVTLTLRHAYDRPGTYFPVLRAAAQGDADAGSAYARVENLGRARVVVR